MQVARDHRTQQVGNARDRTSDAGRTLDAIIRERDLTKAEAAGELRCRVANLYGWLAGNRVPAHHMRAKIEAWTDGRVPVEMWPDDGTNRGKVDRAPPTPRLLRVRPPLVGPSFVSGKGERNDDCRNYETCLDNFCAVFAARSDPHGHCPANCASFKPLNVAAELDRIALSRSEVA